jgi:hypothetical protein
VLHGLFAGVVRVDVSGHLISSIGGGHSRSGRRCSRFSAAVHASPHRRQAAGGAWRPQGSMDARRPEPGFSAAGRRARLAPIFRFGSHVGASALRGGGERRLAARGAGPALFRCRARPRRGWPVAAGRPRSGAMFRSLSDLFARRGLCGPERQPGTPSLPRPGYRVDVPMCVPVTDDIGTSEHRNIGAQTRAPSWPRGLAPASPADA